jgi:hypothetical protein
MLGNANGIDLNNSDLHDLGRVGGLGRVLALRVIQHRPFRRWDDLRKIEGFDQELIKDLRGSGAKLGRISRSMREESEARSTPSTARRKPADENAADAARKRTASNLFSGRGMHPED